MVGKEEKEDTTMVWFDKIDGKEYRVSFEHAKLLYLISHYARSSKSEEQPETWVRELPLDVLMFEGICAGKLDFDYAPVSRQYLHADDDGGFKCKRCYINISQEARSAIDDLIEQDFVKSLKVPNDDNMTTSAFQASQKGMDLLQSLPPILRMEVDDFLYVRKGYKDRVHPKKDLVNVLTDVDGFILVTENGYEARSAVTQVEDVSYVTSPFLPWTYRSGDKMCTDNSTRAWESGVGISQVKKELKEAIVLSQVNILVQEWIPTAANEFRSLLDRFGVMTRNAGGRFTAVVDRHPNDPLVYTQQGLTRVELLDYNSAQCVNFEGEIQFAEDEGVKQVEYIGIHLHTMGAMSCGFRVEAIQNRLADDVSCDLMSRMMVDVIQDTSVMLNDLLTSSQRRAINTIYRGNAASRNKYCLIYADKADPVMKADMYKDRGEYENELRQVLGEIRIAKDIGVGGDFVITGSDGMLIVGRKLRKYDRITVVFGEVMGIQSFMKNSYGRLTILMGDIVKLKRYVEAGDENPEFFESVRQLRNTVSTDLAVLEEMVTYLDDALAALQIPQVPIEDVGKTLYDTVDIKGGLAALDFQLNDMRKLVRGSRMSTDRLSREIRILQTKQERTVGLSIEQNTQRMVEVSHASRRTTAVYGVLHIILGCSFGLLMLDAFISARAKYFGISKMYPRPDAAAGETSFEIDFAAAANVEVGDPTAGGSYFPMQMAIIFDQAPIVGTFCSHLVFMGIFVVLMRRMESFFEASGTRAVTVKFYKRINPRKMEEYISTKAFGRILSTHVEQGIYKGEYFCEKVFRYIPTAPFPWTWHGHAPHIEMRVDFEKGFLVSATFRRGENLSFWKWLVYNQLLRRSQKMSMLGHLDEHMMDRFLKNFEEADVFGVRVPEIYDDIPVTDVFKQIQEVPIDDEGNPLDVLDEMERKLDSRGTGIGADLEAVDVQYDEWGAERVDMDSRGTAGGTSGAAGSESRASTGFFSKTKKTSADLEDLGEEAVEPKKKGLFSRKKK